MDLVLVRRETKLGKQWSGWETEAGRGGIWNSILSPVSDMEELMYGAVMDVERKGLC